MSGVFSMGGDDDDDDDSPIMHAVIHQYAMFS